MSSGPAQPEFGSAVRNRRFNAAEDAIAEPDFVGTDARAESHPRRFHGIGAYRDRSGGPHNRIAERMTARHGERCGKAKVFGVYFIEIGDAGPTQGQCAGLVEDYRVDRRQPLQRIPCLQDDTRFHQQAAGDDLDGGHREAGDSRSK